MKLILLGITVIAIMVAVPSRLLAQSTNGVFTLVTVKDRQEKVVVVNFWSDPPESFCGKTRRRQKQTKISKYPYTWIVRRRSRLLVFISVMK